MRKRFSYANVMATLAFFFALTGASIAGVKYIATSDPISATSDLSGTYGNPQIGSGKVTTTKIADGAVTRSKLADPTDAFGTGFGGALLDQQQTLVPVQTLNLPAGKYLLSATAEVGGNPSDIIECDLTHPGATQLSGSGQVILSSDASNGQMMPLQGTVTLTTPDTVTFECLDFTSAGGVVGAAVIDAVRVNTINGT